MLDCIDLFLCRVGWRVGEWLVGFLWFGTMGCEIRLFSK